MDKILRWFGLIRIKKAEHLIGEIAGSYVRFLNDKYGTNDNQVDEYYEENVRNHFQYVFNSNLHIPEGAKLVMKGIDDA